MKAWGMFGEMLERLNRKCCWIFVSIFIIICIGVNTEYMHKNNTNYLVVRLLYDRNKGETLPLRISYLNKILKPLFDSDLFSIYRKVKYYCSIRKYNIVKDIPLIFDYAFLHVGAGFSYMAFKDFVANDRLGISVIGDIKMGEEVWIRNNLSNSKVVDITDVGTDYEIDDLVRIVSGPFRGYMGTLIGMGRQQSYIIDVKGVKLSVSKNFVRGLEYDAKEETINFM